jgi:hypothetical protein
VNDVIKICFSDFWAFFDYHDNFMTRIMKKRFNVVIDDINPDYVIYSTYGTNFLKYKNSVRVVYLAENVRPNYCECDFSIGFDYSSFGGRNFRFPLYVMYGFVPQLLEKKDPDTILAEKPYFCNMVVSNASSKKRIEFFKLLNKYKQVDSGGKVLNNIGGIVDNKLNFIKNYRFSMAFENSSYPGYTTEKIIEPMKVNSIPIYWGNKFIGNEFNEKSFINVHAYRSLKEAAEAVIELDNDHKKLSNIIQEPWFKENKVSKYFDESNLCDFFENQVFQKKLKDGNSYLNLRNIIAVSNTVRKKIKSKLLQKAYCHVS